MSLLLLITEIIVIIILILGLWYLIVRWYFNQQLKKLTNKYDAGQDKSRRDQPEDLLESRRASEPAPAVHKPKRAGKPPRQGVFPFDSDSKPAEVMPEPGTDTASTSADSSSDTGTDSLIERKFPKEITSEDGKI